jgi:hypothetical protein
MIGTLSECYARNVLSVGGSNFGFLTRAVNTDARYGTFISSENIHITYEHPTPEHAEALAKLKTVDRSGYCVPCCMDGTRESIVEELDKWLNCADASEPNILWLSGGPGAGKSAIASSIVSKLSERCRLGSHFFFRRGDVALSDPAVLWRTMAYDLT